MVDVRDAPEVEQSGKVAGAVHVPARHARVSCRPRIPVPRPEFREGEDRHRLLRLGRAAALSGQALKEMGYTEVYNLGAFDDWADSGGAIDKP